MYTNATVDIRRGGTTVVTGASVLLVPPKIERILASGGMIPYEATMLPPADVHENDVVFITAYQGNPFLVDPVKGRLASDIRQQGNPTPVTIFTVNIKIQT